MSPQDQSPEPPRHPRATEPATLVVTLGLAVVGAVIGVQILTTLGVTPNTSIVGVLIAIVISRIPLPGFRRFRSIHRQNLVQTNISSATFGAANSLLVPIGIPVLIGRPDLVAPMLVGATMGMLIDLAMLYWLFDSRVFPGRGAWPIGVAVAESIRAGDEVGHRAKILGVGAAAGAIGTSGFFGTAGSLLGVGGIPMAALGIAFLGNVWALSMFGVGLVIRGYAPAVLGVDIDERLIPHGMMIGAGLVALGQAVAFVVRRNATGATREAEDAAAENGTRSVSEVRTGLLRGVGLYLVAALLLTAVAGFWGEMPAGQLLGWAVFAAVACIAAEFIVGFSAMHAGWFPAFATALIFLILGMALGFPAPATAVLVGFVASGGPAFADAGYDLKAGWYLRGCGRDPDFERDGRRQQVVAAMLGLLTALLVVSLVHESYFMRDQFPPIVRVYAVTIEAGLQPGSASALLWWAIPGAAIQLLGGAKRQLGVLLATGLLILNPIAGWTVLAGIGARLAISGREGSNNHAWLTVLAAGLIAGDALWSFGSSMFRL